MKCARCHHVIPNEDAIGCYRYGEPLHRIEECVCARCGGTLGDVDQLAYDRTTGTVVVHASDARCEARRRSAKRG